MKAGDRVVVSRTFNEGDLASFVGTTMDLNPFHVSDKMAVKCGFKQRILPGLLPGSMIAHVGGALMPGPFIAYYCNMKFLAPTYVGETLTFFVEIVAAEPDRKKYTMQMECKNEDGEVVLEAEVLGRLLELEP